MKITQEGELLAPGLNIGWMWRHPYIRLIWHTANKSYYFRLRFWTPRIFCSVTHA